MSKISLSPNVSGTGVFTIASPNSNTDRTLTLPDEAGTVLTSTNVTTSNDATISGLTVGRGAGGVATNTAVGYQSLYVNTTGASNTAIGYKALDANTTGGNNVSIGHGTLGNNTTGGSLVAIGQGSMAANTTGEFHVAIGRDSLAANTTGYDNTAIGYRSLYANTTGYSNTVIGKGAGSLITTGASNTIIGRFDGNQGGLDIRTASNYIVLSDGAGNPRLYADGVGVWNFPFSINVNGSGFSKIQGAYDNTTGSAANMHVDSAGLLRRSTSSLKYKREVENATHGLAEVLQLRPVTYKGQSENDGETVFGGLIAEEVHDAGLTEFVQYADDGSPDALAYGNMVSLCIKAIQELKTELDTVKTELATLKGN